MFTALRGSSLACLSSQPPATFTAPGCLLTGSSAGSSFQGMPAVFTALHNCRYIYGWSAERALTGMLGDWVAYVVALQLWHLHSCGARSLCSWLSVRVFIAIPVRPSTRCWQPRRLRLRSASASGWLAAARARAHPHRYHWRHLAQRIGLELARCRSSSCSSSPLPSASSCAAYRPRAGSLPLELVLIFTVAIGIILRSASASSWLAAARARAHPHRRHWRHLAQRIGLELARCRSSSCSSSPLPSASSRAAYHPRAGSLPLELVLISTSAIDAVSSGLAQTGMRPLRRARESDASHAEKTKQGGWIRVE